MSLTNKLFSLLGFAKPITLKRYNGHNNLPVSILVLNIATQSNEALNQLLTKLNLT